MAINLDTLEVYVPHEGWRPATAAERRMGIQADSGVRGYGVLLKPAYMNPNACQVVARCRFDFKPDDA